MSHPSLSSPSEKLAYPSVASSASSSCAIWRRDFWFFQSPPPCPRRWPCPRPRPASPYMFPLDRPLVFPLNAGWPPIARGGVSRARARALAFSEQPPSRAGVYRTLDRAIARGRESRARAFPNPR
jgi:hypothetical protein